MYKNFYENLPEAHKRLLKTVVTYDGEPYYIVAITDHKPDGIFRVYLDALTNSPHLACSNSNLPSNVKSGDWGGLGEQMDIWMEQNPEKLLRKHINSPLFNRFRPFEIGMVNKDGYAYYVERAPNRKTEQGLISSMLIDRKVTFTMKTDRGGNVPVLCQALRDAVKNEYPSFDECFSSLQEETVLNESAAFHRNFALLRGPIGTIFLAYKDEVIGILPRDTEVTLGKEYRHLSEVITDLNIFSKIN